MALIDVVKYQADDNEFVWKFPIEDLKIGTQVVVNPAQRAYFIKGGEIFDEFISGTHTLKTENIPLLNKIINLPFGQQSPFQAEVWYVNLIAKLDNKWGTTSSILLEDPKYGIIIPVRAFGQYGYKISNPKVFLQNLVGNLPSYSADKIQEYFKGKIISSLTSLISKKLTIDNIFFPCWSFKKEETFVGVEQRMSAAASPTKRIRENPICKLEYANNHYRASSIFYCNSFRMEEVIET